MAAMMTSTVMIVMIMTTNVAPLLNRCRFPFEKMPLDLTFPRDRDYDRSKVTKTAVDLMNPVVAGPGAFREYRRTIELPASRIDGRLQPSQRQAAPALQEWQP